MKKKTSRKRENFKNQLSLSFLFTAGFAVIIHVCYFLFFVSNYVLENFVEPNTQQSIVFFIISPIFILAIGFLVAALFTYVMLSPLNEIMRAADCVAKGDYSVRVKPHGLGNLTELGEKFNHMAEEIGNVVLNAHRRKNYGKFLTAVLCNFSLTNDLNRKLIMRKT